MVTNLFHCRCEVTMGTLPAILLLNLAHYIEGIKHSPFHNSAAQPANEYESSYLYFIDRGFTFDHFTISISRFSLFTCLYIFTFPMSGCVVAILPFCALEPRNSCFLWDFCKMLHCLCPCEILSFFTQLQKKDISCISSNFGKTV